MDRSKVGDVTTLKRFDCLILPFEVPGTLSDFSPNDFLHSTARFLFEAFGKKAASAKKKFGKVPTTATYSISS